MRNAYLAWLKDLKNAKLRFIPLVAVSALFLIISVACSKDLDIEDALDVKITSIKLNQTSASLKVGETINLTALISPNNATNKTVTWSSSDTNVATVVDGAVTGITEGSATITATTINNLTATCKIVVNGEQSTIDGGTQSGIYLGITGFNKELYSHPINRLTKESKNRFDSFINGLKMNDGTLLYYSVDEAINKLQSANLPSDITTVAIVTFTDGLDQGSIMMNDSYSDNTEYLNAINQRIKNEKVSGLPITAYSIGLKGKDIKDAMMFTNNLKKLSSENSDGNRYYYEASSMSSVNAAFLEIAENLSKSSYSQTINLKIPGLPNGTLVRFTFDNVSDAAKSKLYIEGTFNLATRSLENVKYVGLTSTSGSTINGTADGIFVSFTFSGIYTSNNKLIDKKYTDEWTYITSYKTWQINSEFDKTENTSINIERSSAAIMLVLDCSSSLENDFVKAQKNAIDFINTLYNAIDEANDSNTPGSKKVETFNVKGVSFDMVRVDGGSFRMGSNLWSFTLPIHSERVNTFYIGETEVTQRLWEVVMGDNPSYHKGENLPVDAVSWDDCQQFIARLNQLTGKKFRLPTEAEWEYAAKGGNKSLGYTYSGSEDINQVAWYNENGGDTTHPVGQKLDNELGIYDMSGNVAEWCSDKWCENYSSPRNSSERVLRGGSYYNSQKNSCVVYRWSDPTNMRYINYGLRLAL